MYQALNARNTSLMAEEVYRELRDEMYMPMDCVDYFLEQDLEDFMDDESTDW